jgi:hypothetical protein
MVTLACLSALELECSLYRLTYVQNSRLGKWKLLRSTKTQTH